MYGFRGSRPNDERQRKEKQVPRAPNKNQLTLAPFAPETSREEPSAENAVLNREKTRTF